MPAQIADALRHAFIFYPKYWAWLMPAVTVAEIAAGEMVVSRFTRGKLG